MVRRPDGHRSPLGRTVETRPSRRGLAVARVVAGCVCGSAPAPGIGGRRPDTPPPDLSTWRRGRAVASLADDRAVDLVHLHGAFNQSNTAVSRAIRRPYVFSPHSGYDPVSLRRSRGAKHVYRLLFERTMLKRAALIAALTDIELTQVRAFGATGPCEVIPNGVEAAPGDVDPRPFRRELGIAPDTPLAVFVGRLDVYRKGLDALVQWGRRGPGMAPGAGRTPVPGRRGSGRDDREPRRGEPDPSHR